MTSEWLLRLAGHKPGDDALLADLIPAAAQLVKVGVTISVADWLALSDLEREAIELAPAAQEAHDEDETWADRARQEFLEQRRARRS